MNNLLALITKQKNWQKKATQHPFFLNQPGSYLPRKITKLIYLFC